MTELERDTLGALAGMKQLVGDIAAQTLPGDRPATMAAVVQAFALVRIAQALEATGALQGALVDARLRELRGDAAPAPQLVAGGELEHEPPDRTERIEIRCTVAEHARWQNCALRAGVSLSAFMRMAARAADRSEL